MHIRDKSVSLRVLDVDDIVTEADFVNDYIKELMSKMALGSLIMTNATCIVYNASCVRHYQRSQGIIKDSASVTLTSKSGFMYYADSQ